MVISFLCLDGGRVDLRLGSLFVVMISTIPIVVVSSRMEVKRIFLVESWIG